MGWGFVQRGCGCWAGLDQPGLVEGVPWQEMEWEGPWGPSQPKPAQILWNHHPRVGECCPLNDLQWFSVIQDSEFSGIWLLAAHGRGTALTHRRFLGRVGALLCCQLNNSVMVELITGGYWLCPGDGGTQTCQRACSSFTAGLGMFLQAGLENLGRRRAQGLSWGWKSLQLIAEEV